MTTCSLKDSAEWPGVKKVAWMPYFLNMLRTRSRPTVAPNMPLETSVASAGDDVPRPAVLILESQAVVSWSLD